MTVLDPSPARPGEGGPSDDDEVHIMITSESRRPPFDGRTTLCGLPPSPQIPWMEAPLELVCPTCLRLARQHVPHRLPPGWK